MQLRWFAAIMVGCSWVGAAQAATLEDEVKSLLETHPQIQAAEKGVKSAGEGITAARSGYLPQVHIQGDTGPNFQSSTSRESTYGQSFMRNGDSSGIVVTQKLYDGSLTDSTVDAAIFTRDMSSASLRATRQNVIMEGVSAYLDILRQSALVKLARENEHRLQTQLNLEDERVQRGSGMAVDVLSAKHRLQIAKERRVAFEGALEQAQGRYLQVYGHPSDVARAIDPLPPMGLLPPTLDEAIVSAARENPNIDAAQNAVKVAEQRTVTAESGYYPTVDLVGKADYASYSNAIPGMSRDWAVLVRLNWDLFSGFRTQAQVAQASYDKGASKDSAYHTSRKTAEAVRLTWSQLSTARERLSLLENAVNLANEVWVARKKMREAGKETIIDVLDAESDITNAEINYVTASYDLRTAAYQLLHDIGRLEADMVDTRSQAGRAPGQQAK